MIKYLYFLLLSICLIYAGCSNNDSTNPNTEGEVLLAQVSSDSVGILNGSSINIKSITGQTLDFTGRDSAKITFYYSGENNSSTVPFQIYYVTNDTVNNVIYQSDNLNITPEEQFADITFRSPGVNQYFRYKITVNSVFGFSYFKFKDLKIYKK